MVMKGRKLMAQGSNFEQGGRSNKGGVGEDDKPNHPPCQYFGKRNHPYFKCWKRPNFRCNKCNQPGHIAKFCKNEEHPQIEAQVVDQKEEEDYFFTTSFSTNKNNKNWLVVVDAHITWPMMRSCSRS